MKHLLFPTTADADAFVQDLQSQNLIQQDTQQRTFGRAGMTADRTTRTDPGMRAGDVRTDDAAEEAGEGAIEGTGVGAVVGAVAGVVATATTVATGGLALPVILGMTALGSGVGAGVGAIGGAAEADGAGYDDNYTLPDEHYDTINTGMQSGGRAIAVDDSVPMDAVQAAMNRHNGRMVG